MPSQPSTQQQQTLASLRKARNWSLADVVFEVFQRTGERVSVDTVKGAEYGWTIPSVHVALALAHTFDTTVEAIRWPTPTEVAANPKSRRNRAPKRTTEADEPAE